MKHTALRLIRAISPQRICHDMGGPGVSHYRFSPVRYIRSRPWVFQHQLLILLGAVSASDQQVAWQNTLGKLSARVPTAANSAQELSEQSECKN